MQHIHDFFKLIYDKIFWKVTHKTYGFSFCLTEALMLSRWLVSVP